jgi:mono/diheme cytochrome c family protein
MADVPKKKTSVNIEELETMAPFVTQKHGSSWGVSEETVRAIKEYMKKHGDERIDDKGD